MRRRWLQSDAVRRRAIRLCRAPPLIAIALAALVTGLYAVVVGFFPGQTVFALKVRTEVLSLEFRKGVENAWPLEGVQASVMEFDPVRGEVEWTDLLEAPAMTVFDLLEPVEGAVADVQRPARGDLVMTIKPGPDGSTALLRASSDDTIPPVPVTQPLLLRLDSVGAAGAQVFPFYGTIVVGQSPLAGTSALLLSGQLDAYDRSVLTGERFLAASQKLDPGDKATLLDASDQPVIVRGFLRAAAFPDTGLIVSAQGIADSARIVRSGETVMSANYDYRFSPSVSDRFLSDPFAIAIAGLLLVFEVSFSIIFMLMPGRDKE